LARIEELAGSSAPNARIAAKERATLPAWTMMFGRRRRPRRMRCVR
jgi:hypothetical protein